MTLEERITARIAEVEQAEHETLQRLIAIRTVLGELRQLLEPLPIVTTGADAPKPALGPAVPLSNGKEEAPLSESSPPQSFAP